MRKNVDLKKEVFGNERNDSRLKKDKKILQTVCEKYKTDLEKKPATIYIREPYPGTQKDAK